ncbi:MAG: hypothetical protein IT449_05515 [Phycisphaerales bacterium]|nr:hypothetical protein [Phycisphaerales bacterium]
MTGRVPRAGCAPAVWGFLIFASAALGAVYNWTGNSTNDGNWSTTTNWTSVGGLTYPGSSDDAVINDPSPRSTVIVNADRTVRNLSIGDGMDVQLDNNLTVNPTTTPGTGKLEFNGSVDLWHASGSTKTLTAEWMIVFSRDQDYTTVTTEASANIVVGS